jgi:hypothetical protein
MVKMNSITINGKSYICQGKSIVVKNGKLLLDGDLITEGLSGNVTVSFTGDLASLECADAHVTGDIKGGVNCADLECRDIVGNVNAADIKCNNIKGDIRAADVRCSEIFGNVNAAQVKYKK